MISWLHNKTANCQTCNEAFYYDASTVQKPPRVCVRCKLDGRAQREAKIKKQAAAALGMRRAALAVRSYDEVGAILGLNAKTVREIEQSALAKLRRRLDRRNAQIFPAATVSATSLL